METADDRREALWTERDAATRAWQDAVRDRDWPMARAAAERAHAIGVAIMALDAAEMATAQVRRAC